MARPAEGKAAGRAAEGAAGREGPAGEKKVKSVVAAGYEAFLGEGVQETAAMQESGAEGSAFAQWVAEAYPEEMASGLPEAVADGDFTSEEAYQILGATMHVLLG